VRHPSGVTEKSPGVIASLRLQSVTIGVRNAPVNHPFAVDPGAIQRNQGTPTGLLGQIASSATTERDRDEAQWRRRRMALAVGPTGRSAHLGRAGPGLYSVAWTPSPGVPDVL
jgi:hypothetical protein